MADCPKCGTEIGRSAYCGCGWKRYAKTSDQAPERRCECAYAGCQHDAVLKVKTPTGWANLCHDHSRIYHHAKAEKYCNELGIDTREKRMAWLRKNWKQIPAALPAPMREPGQDDEELTAVDQA